ncbi:MAG: glycosyltransferase family 2 protein [Bacilli bacterium]|nr:glycosyltransferase family 2 protein [Bacilli bacterium]
MMEKLYLVIPCYNEEDVLAETKDRLKIKMTNLIKNKVISAHSKVVFVNDGSIDNTWNLILDFHKKDKLFTGINLSRNRGHQNALLAGLMTVKDDADMVITLDCDLQDDIDVIDKFIEEYKIGNDIVYGVRKSRKKDTFFKRNSALMLYKLMRLLGIEIIYNHADYRLMSKRAIIELEKFREVNLFLRGIVPLIGYKYSIVYYDRQERFAGKSKYSLKKMLSFALDGITSFTIKPIRFIVLLGFVIFLISIMMLIYTLIRHFSGQTIIGWSSVMTSVWAIGGLQLFSIGIIGEYIGKIYLETKARPRYIIEEYLSDKKRNQNSN